MNPIMTRRVILAGGGHAHLAVLADWARAPLPDSTRRLITASRHLAYSGMLPGWMAGIYRADELLIDLAPLAESAGAELVLAEVMGLDPASQTLQLSNGDSAPFDLLSLATGGETDTTALAGLGDRLGGAGQRPAARGDRSRPPAGHPFRGNRPFFQCPLETGRDRPLRR